ncbi:MAG: hypothetical protein RMX96_21700 [Nostoc sp. ChiSLP02]|nr:hypothetical protein [Nostoc sp. DedSLP05]MDZ8097253.1 hypothetical protein [Nostoc sp. DedSLP01]MDZ8187449.1 hypothetical protein [Nostoc sp. ChiSLP02]
MPSDNSNSKPIDIEDIDKETGTANNDNPDPKTPHLTNFNPARIQELIRSLISIVIFLNTSLIILLVMTFILHPIIFNKEKEGNDSNKNIINLGDKTFIYVVKDEDENKGSRELINLLWTSQITLISGTIAFYFASQNISKN